MESKHTSDRLLRLPEVERLTALKKSTIYRLIQEGKFPNGIRLSARATAWSEKQVGEWVEARKAEGGTQ